MLAIEALIATGYFEELNEDIRATAALRLANPSLTLSELAEVHTPPITKSGLNHRISKIMELAKSKELI